MYDSLLRTCALFLKAAKKRKPWSKKPEGWTDKSVKQYSRTMMKGEEHPFTECVEKMKDHMDNPEKFCASVKDKYKGTKKWRNSEGLKKKKNKKNKK
jgi:hypothetical protein